MTKLKDVLTKALTAKEIAQLRGSFDVVGNIASIEIPGALKKKEKMIAQAVMQQNKSVKTVVKKIGKHAGKYRVQQTKIILGDKNTEAMHRESGALFLVDIARCYFSPRLVTERLRIARLVKEGERVLVMFSGVGPYPIIIAKQSGANMVVGIEANPIAHAYAEKNVIINKIGSERIVLHKGDVRKIIPELKKKFDRIIMPLPKTSAAFLPLTFKIVKKGGMIHIYQFARKNCFEDVVKSITALGKKYKKRCRIVRVVKAGQHAPRTYRICLDIKIV